MHWAAQTARKIIEQYPNKDVYTVASGISPSGNVHIGNFREVATTYFVARELRHLGKEVRFIFSWDDFDRFRKVPHGFSKEMASYLGQPYSQVPFEGTTYANYFEKQFESELSRMGIDVEFLYQTHLYQSGVYDEYIIQALESRHQIFDVITSFKTQEFSTEDRDNFYPVNLYCNHCQKDSTTIIHYEKGEITYHCQCSHVETQAVTGQNIKLNWKVDWPMRWMYEDVIFEPGGRDHSSATGSYNVSKRISKEIFGFEAPIYIPYDFIGVKGGTTKISSSAGNTIVLSDLLRIYDKEIILWFYAKYKNNVPFNISLDEDVLRYYAEFERFASGVSSGRITDEAITSTIALSNVDQSYFGNVSFQTLVTFLPMVKNDINLLNNLVRKDGQNTHHPRYQERLSRAQRWLSEFGGDRSLNLLSEFNLEFYQTLDATQRNWIYKTYELVKYRQFESSSELQSELYAIPRIMDCDQKELKARQKEYFRILYKLLFASNKGPKLSLVFLAFEREQLLELLKS